MEYQIYQGKQSICHTQRQNAIPLGLDFIGNKHNNRLLKNSHLRRQRKKVKLFTYA